MIIADMSLGNFGVCSSRRPNVFDSLRRRSLLSEIPNALVMAISVSSGSKRILLQLILL